MKTYLLLKNASYLDDCRCDGYCDCARSGQISCEFQAETDEDAIAYAAAHLPIVPGKEGCDADADLFVIAGDLSTTLRQRFAAREASAKAERLAAVARDKKARQVAAELERADRLRKKIAALTSGATLAAAQSDLESAEARIVDAGEVS